MANSGGNVRSLERGLSVLRCFLGGSTEGLTMTDVAEQTELSTSTVSRILQTLEDEGFLHRDTTRRYTLGPEMFQFADVLARKSSLRESATPVLRNLRDMYNETAALYVVSGENRVCINAFESTHQVRRAVAIGETLPLTRGAIGPVLLSYLTFETRRRIVGDHAELSESLFAEIRLRGYHENDGLQETGIYAIAAPVFDSSGINVAGLAVTGPSARVTEPIRAELARELVRAAERISLGLGFEGR